MNALPNGHVLGGKYEIADKLGSGGASTVYKVVQAGLNIERALKVLDPHEKGAQYDLFERTFKEEIQLLSHLSHRNLAKILDYGEEVVDSKPIQYFVMEYANAGTLEEALKSEKDPTKLLHLFDEVLDALRYMHDRRVLHSDVKATNVLIHRDPISGKLEAKLSDLGVAKPLGPYSHQANLLPTLREETYFWGTSKYAPPYALDIINQSVPVSRSHLETFLPHYDLYCFGATLAESISTQSVKRSVGGELARLLESPKEIFRSGLPQDQWQYLVDYVHLLLVQEQSKGFKETSDAQEAFQRIDPRKALPALVPEITSVGSTHLITHGNRSTRLSDRAYRVFAHPCFQRLQRLSQLNLVEAIYPEARQPRLSHCLETFELARGVTSHLLGDGAFRLHVGSREIGLFLAASLLHDIGHYPLAHTIEDLRGDLSVGSTQPRADFEMAEFFLNLPMEGAKQTISQILNDEWRVGADEIARIVGKTPPPRTIAEGLFKQLLNGAIDIDKLSYLSGDSRFTGVAYGQGIDIQALVASLIVLSPSRHKVGEPVVGLIQKGINPAESMVVARYHMFSRVYWHHTNRALMAMVRYVMRYVLDDGKGAYSFDNYISHTLSMSDLEALRHISERFEGARKSLSEVLGEEAQNPLLGVLDSSRTIYKRLVSFSQHPENAEIRRCHAFLGKSSTPTLEKLRQDCRMQLTDMLKKKVPDSHVLVDVPRIDKEHDELPVTYVIDQHAAQGVVQLNRISQVIGAVFNDFAALAKKSRVFIHPKLRDDLRSKRIEKDAAKAVEAIVFARAGSQA